MHEHDLIIGIVIGIFIGVPLGITGMSIFFKYLNKRKWIKYCLTAKFYTDFSINKCKDPKIKKLEV